MAHAGRRTLVSMVAVIAIWGVAVLAQHSPYRLANDAWGTLPPNMNGGAWGELGSAYPDRAGNIWVVHKCFSSDCIGRNEPPMLKFAPSGALLESWGAGMLVWPHHEERKVPAKGHQIFKFSPAGKLLMTLGQTGVGGEGPNTFNGPTGVVVAPNGDIFVADGHGNSRIVKLSKDGTFIKQWGKKGTGPGEFDLPHYIDMDSRGRIFVADRNNNRIQIFDQDGNFLDQWKQFGRPTGMYIGADDALYVADHQSDEMRNPGFKRGLYIGSARDGKMTEFIADPVAEGSGAEGVTADPQGNLYVSVVRLHTLRKYSRQP